VTFRHRFITFRELMYTHNSNNVASYLTRNVSFESFEDIYVFTIRNNLIEIHNNPYFSIDNSDLISTFVRYKTEVMCEKYWVQMHSQYRYTCYIDVFKGLITGGCVMGLLIISLKTNILQHTTITC
jgi:esterase/lipase superfamily enzyme